MAFRFKTNEIAAAGIERMTRTHTTSALAGLHGPPGGADAIFDVRKRCKKVRAVLRLVREPLGEKRYRRANVAYRDAGRALSGHRDGRVLLAAFDSLSAANSESLADVDVAVVRTGLERLAKVSLVDAEQSIEQATALLQHASTRLDGWRLDGDSWDLMAEGAAAVHDRGSMALARAVRKPTVERLHELRKQAKYTRYHLRMFRPLSPSMVLPLLAQFEAVGDDLGLAHDLSLLEAALSADPDGFGGQEHIEPVMALSTDRRAEFEAAGLGLARRLYAEDSTAFADRLGSYWELWRSVGPEPVPTIGPAPPPMPPESPPTPAPAPVNTQTPADSSTAPKPTAPPPVLADDLEAMTVSALRALARDRGIVGRSRMKRDELLTALR